MSINEKNKSTTQMADKNWFIMMAIVSVCFAFSPPKAGAGWGKPAPFVIETQKLLASDGAASDYFGYSVSISGDYAIVGAYYDDDKGTNSGSAYIFKWDGTNWVQQQKLTASDGAANDYFGWSVSISGDYAIIGAYGDESSKGSAYIFKWNGINWVQQAKLLASDGAGGDCFGRSVSISGDYAIVGAAYDDDKGIDSGSVYIFKWNGTNWVEQQKLTAFDGAAGDWFGNYVSISGDYAIVGAYGDDSFKGSAYIFKRDVAIWSQQQKLLASDGAASDRFGRSVSISGDLAIVGAFDDDDKGTDSGSAYIFKWNGTNWVEQQKLLASDGAAGDYFGFSVSISGDYAIVGAYYHDTKGSTYIFMWNGTNWVEQQKLLASDGAAGDYFGWSVSISGDLAIVGAYGDDVFKGSAYAFKFCPRADLNDDCKVDLADFAIFADDWLYGTN